LICGLVGLAVGSGDEVIVPAYTYIATAAAVLAVRAIPVIAEIDESLTLDPADVEKKITPRTKAIIPVHMRGTPSRMDELMAIARKYDLKTLEDCAQANGAFYKGRMVGSIGDAGAFSLQQFKIITAGEGGAIVTNDKLIFDRAGCYHDAAFSFWMEGVPEMRLGIPPFLGENYRMSELNGALALAQVRKRERILARLRAIKQRMLAGLDGVSGIRLQDVPDPKGDCGVSLVFFVETSERARRVAESLRREGMAAGSLFDKGIPDRHIYYHWDYVLEKRSSDPYGHPWTDAARPCQVTYHHDMCPRSIDILGRCVVIPLTQVMSDAHVESCVVAMKKVLSRP
jgi:8-amino-3,8-dideoxy-alpha-D-manno-octulosonate transaminase